MIVAAAILMVAVTLLVGIMWAVETIASRRGWIE